MITYFTVRASRKKVKMRLTLRGNASTKERLDRQPTRPPRRRALLPSTVCRKRAERRACAPRTPATLSVSRDARRFGAYQTIRHHITPRQGPLPAAASLLAASVPFCAISVTPGVYDAGITSLPPLPPPIWLLVFGFVKHDETPTYISSGMSRER